MAMLTREQLLAKQPLKTKKITISTGTAYVKQWNGLEKEVFEKSLGHLEDYEDEGVPKQRYVSHQDHFKAKVAVFSLCDKDGVLLLKPEDAPVLAENMLAIDLEVISDASSELNGITPADKARMLKNLGGAQDGASSSSSVKR